MAYVEARAEQERQRVARRPRVERARRMHDAGTLADYCDAVLRAHLLSDEFVRGAVLMRRRHVGGFDA